MNDICLAARLETTPAEFDEHSAGRGRQAEGESCHRANFQSVRRFTSADTF
ncbi:MAG: hypothetical protein KA271_06485 [Propionivibrio sp.]|nr:hypothetical protein [Propionivibrio sp.]